VDSLNYTQIFARLTRADPPFKIFEWSSETPSGDERWQYIGTSAGNVDFASV
jgi:hypothetical protein